MTEARKAEMCRKYARCQQNICSFSAQEEMERLDAEAALEGLRFEMVNRAAYQLAHFIGDPVFELVSA